MDAARLTPEVEPTPVANVDRELPSATDGTRRPRHGGSIIMAAMLGLADVLGHDREPVEIHEVVPDGDRDSLQLDFGPLAPLGWTQEN